MKRPRALQKRFDGHKRLSRDRKEQLKDTDLLLDLYCSCKSTKGSFKLLRASRHIRAVEKGEANG